MAQQLPAGMRNRNPGNIKFIGQPGTTASVNTDQGDPQAVYPTEEAGMQAMYRLLMKKYKGGRLTANDIIAAEGGWTPGNTIAAENVARYAGIRPDQDINFADPASAAKFMRALMLQEHGEASRAYSDQMINAAITGANAPVKPTPDMSFNAPAVDRGPADPRLDTPSTGRPTGADLPGPPPSQYSLKARHPQNPQVGTGGYIAPGAPNLDVAGKPIESTGGGDVVKKQVAKSNWLKDLFANMSPGAVGGGGGRADYDLGAIPKATLAQSQAVAPLDVESAQLRRQKLAEVMARLNSGSLWG